MAQSQSALSELLEALRAGDGGGSDPRFGAHRAAGADRSPRRPKSSAAGRYERTASRTTSATGAARGC